jgi:hypothetical protein
LICFKSSGASPRASLRREAEQTDAAGKSEVILISPQCGMAAWIGIAQQHSPRLPTQSLLDRGVFRTAKSNALQN